MGPTYYSSRRVLSAVQEMVLIMYFNQLYLKTKSEQENNTKVPITLVETGVSSLQFWMLMELVTWIQKEQLETITKEIDPKLKVEQDHQVMYQWSRSIKNKCSLRTLTLFSIKNPNLMERVIEWK